jgi:hypothetical protein
MLATVVFEIDSSLGIFPTQYPTVVPVGRPAASLYKQKTKKFTLPLPWTMYVKPKTDLPFSVQHV